MSAAGIRIIADNSNVRIFGCKAVERGGGGRQVGSIHILSVKGSRMVGGHAMIVARMFWFASPKWELGALSPRLCGGEGVGRLRSATETDKIVWCAFYFWVYDIYQWDGQKENVGFRAG